MPRVSSSDQDLCSWNWTADTTLLGGVTGQPLRASTEVRLFEYESTVGTVRFVALVDPLAPFTVWAFDLISDMKRDCTRLRLLTARWEMICTGVR